MSNTIGLAVRQTFKYVDAWGHLDAWEDLGISAKVLGSPKMDEPGEDADPSEGPVYRYRVVVKPGRASKDEIRRALRDTFEFSNCRHEYDCCGCASGRARVKQVGRRDWLVTQRIGYNY